MAHEPRDASGLAARYEIRVRGELGPAWSDWFAGLVVADGDSGETVMTGVLDQAALHAALRRIRDLGLPLVSMRQIGPHRAAPEESTESRGDDA
jgi:hypothetical protein